VKISLGRLLFNRDCPLARHSGEGRNPAWRKTPRSGQYSDVVPLAREIFNPLDSGLRRNDSVLSNGLSGFKRESRQDSKVRMRRWSDCWQPVDQIFRPFGRANATFSWVPSRWVTELMPSRFSRSITARTRISGAEAPAVRPTQLLPATHSG
jgi:hypothetical protein